MNLYDVVSGSVNKDTAKPTIKYTALINVSTGVPHMVGIIHYDTKGQTRELTLKDLYVDLDPPLLWQFIYDFVRSSANAPLTVTSTSISAMIAALQREDTSGYLAKLSYVYTATMKAELGSVGNVARYVDIDSIMNMWNNEAPASETLTFNLK